MASKEDIETELKITHWVLSKKEARLREQNMPDNCGTALVLSTGLLVDISGVKRDDNNNIIVQVCASVCMCV
jgi:hypothetical protein